MISIEKEKYEITLYKTKEEAAITLEALKAYKELISKNEPGNLIDCTENVESIIKDVDKLIENYKLIEF